MFLVCYWHLVGHIIPHVCCSKHAHALPRVLFPAKSSLLIECLTRCCFVSEIKIVKLDSDNSQNVSKLCATWRFLIIHILIALSLQLCHSKLHKFKLFIWTFWSISVFRFEYCTTSDEIDDLMLNWWTSLSTICDNSCCSKLVLQIKIIITFLAVIYTPSEWMLSGFLVHHLSLPHCLFSHGVCGYNFSYRY